MNNPLIKKSDLDLALARLRAEGGGGGGGTSNYNDLSNKPSINSVTLSGNKTSADLGLANSSEVITAITFNGNPVTVTNNTAAIQSVGDVQDVQINKSSIVSNGVANIPYAGEDQFGVIAIDVANDPGSKYVKISYDDPSHPAGQPSHSQDVYLPLMPSANSPFPYWYLPDATYTQKGAVTLNEWIGTITDNYDEYSNEGYDSTLDGYVRTVTTTNGHFTLTSGNKIRIDNVHFSGYHKHFLNVDGTGAIELLFASNYSVYTGDISAIVSGSIDILYDGTNYLIVNGFAFKQPATPQASTSRFGTVQVDWNNDPGAGWVKITTGSGYFYVPYLFFTNSSSTYPTTQTIRAKWLPSASSSVKGAVIVDNAMSDSSANPVQNSVVKAYIDSKVLPSVTASDNSKILKVISGAWAKGSLNNVDVINALGFYPLDPAISVIDGQYNATLDGFEMSTISGTNFKQLSMYYSYEDDPDTPYDFNLVSKEYVDSKALPTVSSSDNGKVLTVVNGAWDKGTSSGGGVSDVTVNGVSVVTNNVAAVTVPTEATEISFDDTNCVVIQARDCQEGIEGLDYQLDFLGGLFNTRVPVLQANGTYCLTATKSQGGNPSYSWGNAKGVSTITSGGTDAVNSAAVIDYINSLDATNTSY